MQKCESNYLSNENQNPPNKVPNTNQMQSSSNIPEYYIDPKSWTLATNDCSRRRTTRCADLKCSHVRRRDREPSRIPTKKLSC